MADERLRALQRQALLDPSAREAAKRAAERSSPPPYSDTEFADFVRGYLEAAIWTAPEDENGNNLDDWTPDDFSPEARAAAEMDCDAFLRMAWDDLASEAVVSILRGSGEYTAAELHGHDFSLTRNGHGTGFWDRGYGNAGKRLTKMAHKFEEVYVCAPGFGETYEERTDGALLEWL